jgi:cytochrome c2
MRLILVVAVGLAAVIYSANAEAAGDPAKGEALFKQQCHICHQVGPGAKSGIGPVLNGIFGQKAGAVAGFSFSPAMMQAASKGIVWDETNLDKFLEHPQGLIPGTKMAYLGLKNPEQRADVIAYLKTLKSQ